MDNKEQIELKIDYANSMRRLKRFRSNVFRVITSLEACEPIDRTTKVTINKSLKLLREDNEGLFNA